MKKLLLLGLTLLGVVSINHAQTYCTTGLSANGCQFGDYIDDFSIGNYSQTATGCPVSFHYEDRISDTIELAASVTYTYSVTFGYNDQNIGFFIDLNDDGDFDDANEFIGNGGPTGTASALSGSITIPATASQGYHRLRVRNNWNSTDPAIIAGMACNSFSYGETNDYTVNVLPPPPCPPVSNITATSINPYDASFSFSSLNTGFTDLEVDTVGFTPGTGTHTATGTASAGTVSGLMPNTTYHLYIKADCGTDGQSTWSGPYTFTTACIPFTAPYANNFDTEAVNVVPQCWNDLIVNPGNSTINLVQTYQFGSPVSPPHELRFYNGTNGSGSVTGIATPYFSDLTALDKQVEFRVRGNSGDTLYFGSLGLMDDPSTFDTIKAIPLNGSYTFYRLYLDANSNYNGTDTALAFIYDGFFTFSAGYLDDFSYSVIPACPDPISFNINNIFATTIDVSVNGLGSSFDYAFDTVGFLPSNGTATIQTGGNPYSVTGLTAGAMYDIYVRQNCTSTGDGTSPWIGPLTFTTACNSVTLPYVEDFNTSLGCMLAIDGGNTNDTWQWEAAGGTSVFGDIDGTGFAIANSDGAGCCGFRMRELLESPSIDASTLTGSLLIKFDQYYRTIGNDTGAVEVFDGTSWHRVYENISTNQGAFSNPDRVLIDASQYANANFKVRFVFDDNAQYGWWWAIDSVSVTDVPCLQPLSISASGITSSSAIISSAGSLSGTYDYEFDTTGFVLGTGTMSITGGTNPDTLTGLQPNTLYDVYVRKNCGGGTFSSWSGPFTFRTLCTPFTVTYNNNFDADATGSVPLCWSAIAPNPTTVSVINFTGPHSAPNHVQLYNSSGGAPILVSPEFSDLSHNKQVEFWAKGSGRVIVGTMSDPAIPSSFHVLDTIALTNTYEQQFVNFDSATLYNFTDKFVAFKHGNLNTFTSVYIDDFVYRVKPPCQDPFAYSLVSTTDSSATFSFGNSDTSYQYNWGPLGFTQGTGIVNSANGNPLTLYGFGSGQTYDIYFRTNCSANGGGFSSWVGPFTFSTACSKQSLPFVENFNTQPSLGCMQAVDGGTGTDTWVYEPAGGSSVSGDLDGTPFAVINSDGAGFGPTQDDDLITPEIDASNIAGTLTLEWDQFYQDLASTAEVYVWDSLQWVNVYSAPNTIGAFGAPDHQLIDITAHANSELKVKFHYEGNYDWWWLVDNIKVRDITCPSSTDFVLSSKTYNSASFNWTASTTSLAFHIEYGPVGFSPGSGVTTSVAGSPTTISNLAAGTEYDFYLIDSCSGGDMGYPIGPLKVRTDCAPTSAPFSENFDGAAWTTGTSFNNAGAIIDPCWNSVPFYNGISLFFWGTRDQAYQTTTGPTNDISGSGNFVYVESSYGGFNDSAFFSTPYIDISSLTNPSLSFYYHMFGNSMGELRVDILDGDTWINDIYSLSGQQQASATEAWKEVYLSLAGLTTHDTIRVRFTSIKNGFGGNGDMAIDEVSIANGVADDLMILSAAFNRVSPCLTNNDTIDFKVVNNIGAAVDFSNDPLTLGYTVTGPVNTTGSVVLNTGTLPFGDTVNVQATNIDMSLPGEYKLNLAYISSNAVNLRTVNDTLNDTIKLTVYDVFDATPDTIIVTDPADTFEISVSSPFLTGTQFFITEHCQFKGAGSGAPAGGWPAYMSSTDDYIEITGIPNSDLGGITYEQWNTTGMVYSYTFPTGTLLGPNGTAVVGVGDMVLGNESPSDFFYQTNFTGFSSSGDNLGKLLKDANGTIIDAVVSNSFVWPVASGVTTADWTGTLPNSGSSAGNRLEGPDLNNQTGWISTLTSGAQDPNVLNNGVILPTPTNAAGFAWMLNGTQVDTLPTIFIGPFPNGGTFEYIATYNSPCGLLTDTVLVLAGGACNDPSNVTGVAGCDNITVSWNDGTGNSIVTYGTGTTFSSVTVAGSSTTLTGLQPGTSYTIAVSNICPNDTSNTVGTTITTLDVPVASFVAIDTTDNGDGTVTIDFDASGSTGATSYSWDFGNGSTATGVTASGTFSAGSYTVTLVVSNACGSDTITFNFTGVGENPISRSLNVYPNPSNNLVNISFDGATSSNASIRLMDASGREMIRMSENINGGYNGQLDVSKLSKGIYLIEIQAGDMKAQRRLSVN